MDGAGKELKGDKGPAEGRAGRDKPGSRKRAEVAAAQTVVGFIFSLEYWEAIKGF